MSDLSLSPTNPNDPCGSLTVTVRGAKIIVSELRVKSRSASFDHPHLLLGMGGSSLSLTNADLAFLLSEYLRLRGGSSVTHTTPIRTEP